MFPEARRAIYLFDWDRFKETLLREGLFEARHKKTLPAYPRRVGIVTSPTGAAFHDIIKTTELEFSKVDLILYPAVVQGEAAAQSICDMIQRANEHNEVELLIVGRGGGSFEDLAAFN